jgi:outer membrane protein assembly factor BamB
VHVRAGRIVTAAAMTMVLSLLGAAPAAGGGADWTGYLFDARHGSWNAAATAITPADAAGLAPDWTFTAAAPVGDQPAAAFVASPTVAGGRVFIGANTGVFTALDEATGDPQWNVDLGHVTMKTCAARGVTSTATVAFDPSRGEDVVYVGGGDGYLYALAADDGEQVWRSLVVEPGVAENEGYNWASPIVVGGRVLMGVASECDRPLVRGGLRAFDQATGAHDGTYWSMPKGTIGASVWTSPASRSGDVWFTTGNAQGGGQPGDSYSMLRVGASTLAREDKWVVPGADQDLDWGSSPTLFDRRIDGRLQRLVGACSKNGRYYVLRAGDLHAGPVWSRKLGVDAREPNGGSCLAATIWDPGHRLLIAGANRTTLEGVTVPGSLRALSPRDGSVRWATALPDGPVMGAPTLNGSGVVAAGTYDSADPTTNAVYLVDAADGSILRTILVSSPVFAQPVFAGSHLFVADTGGTLTAYA